MALRFGNVCEARGTYRNHICLPFACALVFAVAQLGWAQTTPIIYPKQGQSMQQQASDEAACRTWAQQQTGFSPTHGPNYVGGYPTSGGQVIGGAASGAALGAVGGAIAGDAGKGAAIGAGVGAAAGLMRKVRSQRNQQRAQQQAINQYNQQLANYDRAFAVCMQGRGYVVG